MLHFSRLKILFISLTILIGLFFFIPNFLNTPSKIFPEKKVVLGLDLQGGSYLLLEVDSKPLFQEKIDTKAFDIRKKIRSERINYTNFKINNSQTISFQINLENKNKIEKLLNDKDINSRVDETNKELQFVINDNIVNINFSAAYLQRIKKNAMEQSLEIIRSRIDELGTREPTIIAQGEERILIELPGIKNPKRIKEIIGTTAKLSFKFLANNDANSSSFDILGSKSNLEKFNVEKTLVLSGEHLTDAQPGFDNINNNSVVNFKLDNFGAKKFAYATKNNIGRRLAIVIDNQVVSAPTIRDAITAGSGQISGGFSVEEANNLAIVLRSGALPAPMSIIEERTVGPDLGQESIDKGIMSLIIGFVLVIIYILINYKILGIFANISLLINLILLLGTLTLIEATLTLPGIAGIILTVGMAVDANVLIYERIKEELLIEKNIMIAFDNGYKRVLTTLLDANITTLIAAIVLYFIGSGPVKGFAVTLAVGIITSLFTTFILGRLFVASYVKSKKGEMIKI
ncbi:MAG: protein translocase subunit SecD [alpha proteobacterium HIMB114]|nr:MAG: protein translocase subunit SecD [alpha proteobacterium HIMB114]